MRTKYCTAQSTISTKQPSNQPTNHATDRKHRDLTRRTLTPRRHRHTDAKMHRRREVDLSIIISCVDITDTETLSSSRTHSRRKHQKNAKRFNWYCTAEPASNTATARRGTKHSTRRQQQKPQCAAGSHGAIKSLCVRTSVTPPQYYVWDCEGALVEVDSGPTTAAATFCFLGLSSSSEASALRDAFTALIGFSVFFNSGSLQNSR